jgi:hypothetical protein
MKLDACKKIIAEWLEEQVLFAAIRRQAEPMELGNSFEILAIVGLRRWGKPFHVSVDPSTLGSFSPGGGGSLR